MIFDIVPGEEGGTFQVKARFMGVDMEKFPLKYQVSLGSSRIKLELTFQYKPMVCD